MYMYAATSFIVTVSFLPLGCYGRNVMIVAHNTTINFTCTDGRHYPTWFVNETTVGTEGHGYRTIIKGTEEVTATLTINGNIVCDTLNIHCEAVTEEGILPMHNTTVKVQGRLPSPESVQINESVNSSTIQWKPPYSAMNNDIVHVDAHITQYTVYITDNYTGNIATKNVTETQFTFNTSEDSLCLTYQVSAWNAGGEGEMSEPVQEMTVRTPQVPHNIAVAPKPDAINIHINVDVVCTSRLPEFFLITLMTPTGSINETRQHQPGQPVANFTISLLQSVEMCTLHVRISAGNNAGMSAPSEAVEVVCSGGNTESTTTTDSTTVTVSPTTASIGNRQQGDNTILIVITIGVIAAVGVMLAVGIICCLKHKSKNRKDPSDQTDNCYSKSPSLGGPVLLYKPQVGSHPERTSITDSEGSNDHLLQPSPPAPVLYAQVDPVKQTQVQPPANDDPVQYAQIKHQDKL